MRIVLVTGDQEEGARAAEAVARLLPGAVVEQVAGEAHPDLWEHAQRYRELFEHAKDIIFTLDFSGRFTSINKSGERLLGYTKDEITQRSIWHFMPPEVHPEARQRLAAKAEGGEPTSYVTEVITRRGQRILLDVASHTLYRDGRPFEILVISRDVTERRRAEEALRESEERFRELFEHANDAVCITTIEGDFIAVNQAGERAFGRPRDELRKLNLNQIIAPDQIDLVNRMRDRKLAGGGRTLYEVDIVRPDGRAALEVNSSVVFRDGNPVAILAIARDITERRRAEQALRESEERYRSLVDGATDVVYTTDLDGNFTAVNRAGERLLGLPREEIVGRNMSRFIAPEHIDLATRMRQAQPRGEEQALYELAIVTPDGRRLTLELSTRLIRRDGQPVGIQGIARDITERKRFEDQLQQLNLELEQRVVERTATLVERERELRDAKRSLEHLIRSSPGVIVRGSPDGMRTLYVSPNVEQLLGYTTQEIVATDGFWPSHVHPDDRERVRIELAAGVAERRDQIKLEHRFRMKDGTYRWLLSMVRPEYHSGDTPSHVLAYIVDITERMATEEAVKQAEREADRANRAKSAFLSRMSHELRTPLNAIIGFAQLMEFEAADEPNRESAQHILHAGQHLLELINEILDISKIESDQMRLSLEPVEVSQVAEEALNLVAPLAAGRGLAISRRGASPPGVRVLADSQRLKQVLLNLLSNAVKYNRAGGEIDLSWEDAAPDRVRILVADTGTGIPPDRLGKLFTPFDRLGMEGTGVEGTGLGLALSKRLVELMGGTIGVKSTPGEGTVFWIDLARVEEHPALATTPRDPARAELAAAAGGVDRCVLYVEDNLSNIRLIEGVLARRPRVRLLTAMQGRIALDLTRDHTPDLILLDLHLPDIPGEELLRRLKDDARTRQIPVVVISAEAGPRQMKRLLAAGAADYLTKPIDLKRLLGIVDALGQAQPA
jgi:PAS domain S-box-containing protein